MNIIKKLEKSQGNHHLTVARLGVRGSQHALLRQPPSALVYPTLPTCHRGKRSYIYNFIFKLLVAFSKFISFKLILVEISAPSKSLFVFLATLFFEYT